MFYYEVCSRGKITCLAWVFHFLSASTLAISPFPVKYSQSDNAKPRVSAINIKFAVRVYFLSHAPAAVLPLEFLCRLAVF